MARAGWAALVVAVAAVAGGIAGPSAPGGPGVPRGTGGAGGSDTPGSIAPVAAEDAASAETRRARRAPGPQDRLSEAAMADARARWGALDAEERERFRDRFRALARLSPKERAVLEERADELARELRELRESLPPALARRLAALEPERRDEILREFLAERRRVRGTRVRHALPPVLVARLEAAPPGERAALLQDLRDRARRVAGLRLLAALEREAGLDPAELDRLRALEPRERVRAALELRRELLRRRVAEEGPPLDLTEDEWRVLDALPLESFLPRWHDVRAVPVDEPPPRGRWNGVSRPPTSVPFDPALHRGERLERLAELARPTLEDLVDLAHLHPRERRARVEARIRERCLAFLADAKLVSEDRLAALADLRGSAFVEQVRALVGRLAAGAPRGPGPRRPLPRWPPTPR